MILESWKFRLVVMVCSLFPTVLYSLNPFGPLHMDEVMVVTYHTWYAPWFYICFSASSLLTAVLMCLPVRVWNHYRWLILVPFFSVSFIVGFYYLLQGSVSLVEGVTSAKEHYFLGLT